MAEEKDTQVVAEEAAAPTDEVKEEAANEAPEAADAPVEVPEKFKKIVGAVEEMTVLELHELVKVLEKKFGVSAAATMTVAAAGAGEAAEEKTEFTIELTSAGESKIGVIKAVKNALGLGLKEAKDLVESAPAVLKENAKKDEAEDIKKAIEEAGGKVTLK